MVKHESACPRWEEGGVAVEFCQQVLVDGGYVAVELLRCVHCSGEEGEFEAAQPVVVDPPHQTLVQGLLAG